MRAFLLAIAAGVLMASGCCAPCATSCGPNGCGSPCAPDTLLPHLVEQTRCASGCGEVYLGEWYADPPQCDPCDRCGNYTGPVDCCKPMLQQLWGTRYEGGCCESGCASCNHGADGHFVHDVDHGQMHGYDTYNGPVEQMQTPTPAPREPMESTPEAGGGPTPPMPMLPPDDSDLYRDKAPALPQPAQPAQPLDGNPRAPSTTRAYHPNQVYQARGAGSPFQRSRRR